MAWTDYEDEILRTLWADRVTGQVIADRIGGDKTRNAVVGRAARLGLERRENQAVVSARLKREADEHMRRLTGSIRVHLQALGLKMNSTDGIAEALAYAWSAPVRVVGAAIGVSEAQMYYHIKRMQAGLGPQAV